MLQDLHEVSTRVRLTETKRTRVVSRGWRKEEMGNCLSTGIKCQQDE